MEANIFQNQMLTVVLSPQAGGGVESYPAGIYCGIGGSNLCSLYFSFDSEVLLEAYPNDGYAFAYWDDGANHYTGNPHMFTMNTAKTVTAVFVRSVKWPLSGNKEDRTIISGFGDDWLEYCGGLIMKHAGIDIAATITPADTVYAAEAGIVKVAQLDQEWGGWVTLEHNSDNNPFTTVYIHIIPSVSTDDPVSKGDPIGTVTDYGGPIHLHFGIREGLYSNTSNRGRLPQTSCGGDPAYQESFKDPSALSFE